MQIHFRRTPFHSISKTAIALGPELSDTSAATSKDLFHSYCEIPPVPFLVMNCLISILFFALGESLWSTTSRRTLISVYPAIVIHGPLCLPAQALGTLAARTALPFAQSAHPPSAPILQTRCEGLAAFVMASLGTWLLECWVMRRHVHRAPVQAGFEQIVTHSTPTVLQTPTPGRLVNSSYRLAVQAHQQDSLEHHEFPFRSSLTCNSLTRASVDPDIHS